MGSERMHTLLVGFLVNDWTRMGGHTSWETSARLPTRQLRKQFGQHSRKTTPHCHESLATHLHVTFSSMHSCSHRVAPFATMHNIHYDFETNRINY